MMKILIITDILAFRFYEYIEDIFSDILIQNIDVPKINQNSWKCNKNLVEM